MKKIILTVIISVGVLQVNSTHAQIGRALRDKIKSETEKKIQKSESEEEAGPQPDENRSVANTKGEGLIFTPPDVKENMAEAETAFKAKNYADAKNAVRQAIIGVEMEMGQNVLKSLPDNVAGLDTEPQSDQVSSSAEFLTGLTISRKYAKEDKELNITIANNSMLVTSANAYLSNPAYASSSSEQNYKPVKVKEFKGVLEFDESSGYKLSLPIGQTSIIILEGMNFQNEPEVMAAADSFDYENIKKQLGEK